MKEGKINTNEKDLAVMCRGKSFLGFSLTHTQIAFLDGIQILN